MNGILVCAICGQAHFDYDADTVKLARGWGFFVCGMLHKSHMDENWVRKTILVTKSGKSTRHDIFTGKQVQINLEEGM